MSVLGPAGCGKSSLAMAGLIPELARRPLPTKANLRVVVMVPGSEPLEALAGGLAIAATEDAMPVAKKREFTYELQLKDPSQGYSGLRRISDLMPQITAYPLVVLVDQFEEVYSRCKDLVKRQAFIENLLLAATDPTGNLSVVITLRSDFIGETQRHQALNQIIGSDQSVIVPAMSLAELGRAIAEPAKKANHPIDEATIERLVQDVKGREGALPLLQFTLTQIWEGLRKEQSPLQTYREIGGIGGALAARAEEIYNQLLAAEQAIAQRIFLSLVELEDGIQDTRRRIRIKGLTTNQHSLEEIKGIIQQFATPEARLITLSSLAGEETAEVTHEALFDHWPLLQSWLNSDRGLIQQRRKIESTATEWKKWGKKNKDLPQGSFLNEARKQFIRNHKHLYPLSDLAEEMVKKGIRRNYFRHLIFIAPLITFFLVTIPLEIFFRERKNSQDLLAISDSEPEIQKEAVLRLVEGCGELMSYNYFIARMGERLYGNCRTLRNRQTLYNISFLDEELNGVNFSNSNLSNSDFSLTELVDSNLRGTNLLRTNFRSANLTRADLSGANLEKSELRNADLTDANLTAAYLKNADLRNVNLKRTNLNFANLEGVKFIDDLTWATTQCTHNTLNTPEHLNQFFNDQASRPATEDCPTLFPFQEENQKIGE